MTHMVNYDYGIVEEDLENTTNLQDENPPSHWDSDTEGANKIMV